MRKVVLTLVLGIALFGAIDALVFRAPIYRNLLQPESSFGVFWYLARFEKMRPPSGFKEILVVGDSRIAEGLSEKLWDQLGNLGNTKLINGGVSGSSLRDWYYYLREVDPNHNRYAAIALPFIRYEDQGVDDWSEGRVFLDAHIAASVLRVSDIGEWVSGDLPFLTKIQIARDLFFKGFLFREDVKDFILHPRRRFFAVKTRLKAGAGLNYEYTGHLSNLNGLRADLATGRVASPLVLSQTTLDLLEKSWLSPAPAGDAYSATITVYREKWLGKIVDAYRGSKTRLVVFRMPSDPFAPQKSQSLPDSQGVVAQYAAKQWLIALSPDRFARLERGEYFFDHFHLNHEGRIQFTKLLGTDLVAHLASLPAGGN